MRGENTMQNDIKNFIQLNLEILKGSLKEAGVLMGAMVDKSDPEKTKLVFLDKEKYIQGQRDGFTVEFDTINNW